MKYRVTSGWDTGTGLRASIWRLKSGITDPLLPSTFPNRVVMNFVLDASLFDCAYISATRLDAPITLVGFTALSVEIRTKVSTLYFTLKSTMVLLPNTLVRIASLGFNSINRTCLYAAA